MRKNRVVCMRVENCLTVGTLSGLRMRRVDRDSMKAWIDGQPFSATGETCAEVLEAARVHAAATGRVVVSVEVDGEEFVGDAIGSLAFRLAASASVRMTTESPRVLVREALMDAAGLLRQTDGPREEAIKHIRGGRLADALRSIESVARTWEQVRGAAEQSAELLGVEVRELLAGPITNNEASGNPASALAICLSELKRCVEHADWSGLADVMEYDLAEETVEWFERLVAAAGRLEESATLRAAG